MCKYDVIALFPVIIYYMCVGHLCDILMSLFDFVNILPSTSETPSNILKRKFCSFDFLEVTSLSLKNRLP